MISDSSHHLIIFIYNDTSNVKVLMLSLALVYQEQDQLIFIVTSLSEKSGLLSLDGILS